MTFSVEVKEELTRLDTNKKEAYYLLKAILVNNTQISISDKKFNITYQTKSNQILRFFIKLISEYNVLYSIIKKTNTKFNANKEYVLFIQDAKKIIDEFKLFDLDYKLDKEYELIYLRGVFIAKGSVNAPLKPYHLEFSLSNEKEALLVQRIINTYNYNARIIKRKDNLVVYLKDYESILDLLRLMGLSTLAFLYEDKHLQKQIKANAKRMVNFDISNQTKTMNASKEDIKAIKYIKDHMDITKLDDKLLIVMHVRLDNPYASLDELASIINKRFNEKITKSGISHRIRKIRNIYEELKDKV